MLSLAQILFLPHVYPADCDYTQLPRPNVIDKWLAAHNIEMENEVVHSDHLDLPSLDSPDACRGTRLLDWARIRPQMEGVSARSGRVSCILQLKVTPASVI